MERTTLRTFSASWPQDADTDHGQAQKSAPKKTYAFMAGACTSTNKKGQLQQQRRIRHCQLMLPRVGSIILVLLWHLWLLASFRLIDSHWDQTHEADVGIVVHSKDLWTGIRSKWWISSIPRYSTHPHQSWTWPFVFGLFLWCAPLLFASVPTSQDYSIL